jgi:hypothetical protein
MLLLVMGCQLIKLLILFVVEGKNMDKKMTRGIIITIILFALGFFSFVINYINVLIPY